MNRLTIRNSDGAWDVPLRNDDGAYIPSQEIIDRLAEYEETGLEPEEIKRSDALLRGFIDLSRRHERTLSWMEKVMIADREGRLIVLPCKVGDTVYLPATDDWGDILSYEVVEMGIDRDGPYFVINDEDHDHTPMEELGKSVFLTREDAEKALEGENNDHRID